MIGIKRVKNAVGAQSGEDSLRASHLKGDACLLLTIIIRKKREEEKREISQLIWRSLSFVFVVKVRHSHKVVFRPPYLVWYAYVHF